jgi:tRNA (cmo5U34)-methyltransferase
MAQTGLSPSADVGDDLAAGNGRWTFGGRVSETFDAHVARSVPLYDIGHDLVAKLSDFFLAPGSTGYELGCSTGTLTELIATRNADRNIRVVGVDVVREMTDRARARCAHLPQVEIVTEDIIDVELEPCDLVVSYYTLQFIRPKHRQMVFDRIYEALNWGGAFIMFEKVRGADARFQDIASALYTDYKLDQGYGPEEIVGKARSLKGVLEPFSTQGNLDLFARAGFVDVTTVMKYVCFEGFLAIK